MDAIEQSRKIFTTAQAAAFLQVNKGTIRRYIRQGQAGGCQAWPRVPDSAVQPGLAALVNAHP